MELKKLQEQKKNIHTEAFKAHEETGCHVSIENPSLFLLNTI